MMGITDRPDSRGNRPDSRGSSEDIDIDDSRSDRSDHHHHHHHDLHHHHHDDHDPRDHHHHHHRPSSSGDDRDCGSDRDSVTSSIDRPPVVVAAPKLKMGALDIANMIAKHKPVVRSSSPEQSSIEHSRSAMAEIRPLNSTGVKPLDLSHYSRLPMPPGFKGGFYPYPGAAGITLPPTLPGYPYTPADAAVALSAAGAMPPAGGQSLPLYSYPLTETGSTPSISTLRLSALLASRKRRQAGSTSSSGESLDDLRNTSMDSENGLLSGLSESSRKKVRPVPEEKKDGAYWERRRKNNDAAKRSRDARRMKEEEIALRAVFLEQENMKLRAECSILKSELGRLHFMVYNC